MRVGHSFEIAGERYECRTFDDGAVAVYSEYGDAIVLVPKEHAGDPKLVRWATSIVLSSHREGVEAGKVAAYAALRRLIGAKGVE